MPPTPAMSTSFYHELCGTRGRPDAVAIVHAALRSFLKPGDFAVDATAGNGGDTVQLAQCVSPGGLVLAIDIQKSALATCAARCREAALTTPPTLLQASHEEMANPAFRARWPATPTAITFNLGYLPGGDHGIVTRTQTTLLALKGATAWLRPGGLLAVVCYPGHPEGARETDAVLAWASGLPPETHAVSRHQSTNTRRPAPITLLIHKIA